MKIKEYFPTSTKPVVTKVNTSKGFANAPEGTYTVLYIGGHVLNVPVGGRIEITAGAR